MIVLYSLLVVLTTLALTYDHKVAIISNVTGLHVQIGLTFVAGVLLYAHLSNVELDGVWLAVFVMVMILLPGISALQFIGPTRTGSRWEDLGLAYGLGFSFDCVAGILVLGVAASQRGTWLLSSTLMLSLLSILIQAIQRTRKDRLFSQVTISIGYDDLLLIGTLVALLLIYAGLYPTLSTIPGLDIYRNYLDAKLVSSVSLSAGLPSTDGPLLYLFQSLPFSVASPSESTFQTAYILLYLFIVVSFYAMARVILKGYPRLAPAVATLFWSLFSGFGWIEYVAQTANTQAQNTISAIGTADVLSYGDLTFRRDFFFLSMEASLAIVFLIIYASLKTDMGHKRMLVLVPLATLIPLLHPYAMYFLLLFLGIWTFASLEVQRQGLRQVGFAFLIAALTGAALSYVIGIRDIEYPFGLVQVLAFAGLGILLFLSPSLKFGAHAHFRRILWKVNRDRAILLIASAVMILYLGFLLSWAAGAVPFNFQSLDIFGYVPWELYPVRLGIIGALAILGFLLTFKKTVGHTRELVSMLILTALIIVSIRATSEFQLLASNQIQLFAPGSVFNHVVQIFLSIREERFLDILLIPLSLTAAVAVTVLATGQNKHTISRLFVVFALVSMLVAAGTSSTILGFEYYQSVGNNDQPNPLQVSAIQNVQSQAISERTSLITSPTTSPSFLELSDSTVIVTESAAIWSSMSPEFPLSVLRYTESTPTYIFLEEGADTAALTTNDSTYLAQLAGNAGTTFQNQGAEVKLVQNMSAPSSSSTAALVVPYDATTESIISPVSSKSSGGILALYFTPGSSADDYSGSSPIYSNVQINDTAVFNGRNSYISIPDRNDYPNLQVEFSFQPLSVLGNHVIVSKLDYGGANPQESWEVAQYGQSLGFKVSPDGSSEFLLQTGNMLTLGKTYLVNCVYDGTTLTISVDNQVVASEPYNERIFDGTSDIIVGGELSSGQPAAFASMLLNFVTVSNSVHNPDSEVYTAYDFLSSAELNYTSVLAQDSHLSEYSTLVLPYDDASDNTTLTSAVGQTDATKTIIVLNDNGFGPILGAFGRLSSQSLILGEVASGTSMAALERPVNASIITPNDDVNVMASYSNGNMSTPFIMSRSYGSYTVVYVNVFPLVQKGEIVASSAERLAGAVLEPFIAFSNPHVISPWYTSPSIIFSSMNSTGSISIKSNSIVGLNETNGMILESGGTKITVGLPSALAASGYNLVKITASKTSISGGYGFYSFVTLSNGSLVFSGTALVNVTAGESHISGHQVSVIVPNSISLVVRQPMVSIDGLADFEGFYSLHPPSLYSDGRQIQLKGSISFQMYSSDASSVALPVSFGAGTVASYETPLMSFSEWSAFLASVPYVVLTACATILAFLTWFLLKKHGNEGKPRFDSGHV
jgi:hypothetical protein